jgi:hypothetical protein
MGYRGKIVEQNRARDLRKLGWTLAEICEELGVSKASASLWCRGVEIDEVELERRRRERFLAGNEGAHQRGPNKLQLRKEAQIQAGNEIGRQLISSLSPRDLRIAAVALYAGEGSKTDGAVKFANSDPRMVALFLSWLRDEFEVDEKRLRMNLYLHHGLDLDAAIEFWSAATRIPATQFTKPYRAVADPSIRRAKHPMGCAAVVYACSETHRRLMGMVRALLSSPVSGPDQLGPRLLPG